MTPESRRPLRRALRDGAFARLFDAAATFTVAHDVDDADRLGRRLGALAGCVTLTERRRVRENLAFAFPGLDREQRREIEGEVFRHLGSNLAEILRIVGGRGAELVGPVRWIGRERLDAAAALGRGVVLVTGHCGNWELLGAAVVAAGHPLTVVARGMKDPALEARALEVRRRGGMAIAVRDTPGSSKALLGALRSGGCLGVLIDQDIDAEGVFVPFFGRLAWTPVGAASLALRRGAPILPILSRRLAPGLHEIEVFDPIEPAAGLSGDDAARDVTAQATAVIERWIRRTPAQWVWMHRRWKRRPAGE